MSFEMCKFKRRKNNNNVFGADFFTLKLKANSRLILDLQKTHTFSAFLIYVN